MELGVSRKRLLGWEPSERHEHYDAAGELTGFTVVTREPEWDDAERVWLQAMREYQAGVHKCGFHKSLTSDKANGFTFEDEHCNLCAGVDKWERVRAERDQVDVDMLKREYRGGDVPPTVDRPSDGRSTFVRMLTPDEVAARRRT